MYICIYESSSVSLLKSTCVLKYNLKMQRSIIFILILNVTAFIDMLVNAALHTKEASSLHECVLICIEQLILRKYIRLKLRYTNVTVDSINRYSKCKYFLHWYSALYNNTAIHSKRALPQEVSTSLWLLFSHSKALLHSASNLWLNNATLSCHIAWHCFILPQLPTSAI